MLASLRSLTAPPRCDRTVSQRGPPAHERQARAHGDDENVRARIGLAGH